MDEWGPILWKEMHLKTFETPMDKLTILEYFNRIPERIPCDKCKKHYTAYIRRNPIPTDNRDDLIHWLIDLHNDVNKRTGKKILTYKEARSLYETNYWFLLLIILILYVSTRKIFKWPFKK